LDEIRGEFPLAIPSPRFTPGNEKIFLDIITGGNGAASLVSIIYFFVVKTRFINQMFVPW